MNLYLTTLLIFFVFISISHAASTPLMEPTVLEFPKSHEIQTARGEAYSNYPDSARFNLDEFSTEEENKIKELVKKTRPLYSGIGRELSLSRDNWVRVKQDGGFDVWQVHIHSPSAVDLQVHFTDFNLANGMSVNVYSYDKSDTHTKEYTGRGWTGNGEFWSQPVMGDVIVVEFWSPTNKGLSFSNFPFSIDRISHTFRDKDGSVRGVSFQAATPKSHGSCDNNVRNDVCRYTDAAIVTARQAVAKYRVTPPSGTGWVCTGTLVRNDKRNDRTLYFLTAWHCVDDVVLRTSARGKEIPAHFTFSATDCNNSPATVSGATFIAGDDIGDYALLRITGSPTGGSVILLAGARTDPFNPGDGFINLHHSVINDVQTNQNYTNGTVRRLELVVGRASNGDLIPEPCQGSGCSHSRAHYSIGGTFGGASGASALKIITDSNNNRYAVIVGVLSYGSSSCDDGFSRFSKIYEDGRVVGALTHGADYCSTSNCTSTGAAANFDDSAEPQYHHTRSSGGGGGGGGGAIELWFLLLLLPLLLLARLKVSRRSSLKVDTQAHPSEEGWVFSLVPARTRKTFQ